MDGQWRMTHGQMGRSLVRLTGLAPELHPGLPVPPRLTLGLFCPLPWGASGRGADSPAVLAPGVVQNRTASIRGLCKRLGPPPPTTALSSICPAWS